MIMMSANSTGGLELIMRSLQCISALQSPLMSKVGLLRGVLGIAWFKAKVC